MGSVTSKPTPTPRATTSSEKMDEKRAMSVHHTAHVLAQPQYSGGHQSEFKPTGPGLTLSKLEGWQEAFDSGIPPARDHPGKGGKGVYPGPVTNQKSSGRCWLFATTNCLRYRVIPQLNLGEFQLSQSYLFFYDKLEKANIFLENILDLVDSPLDSRIMTYLMLDPVGDGGQFDMAVNIVEKYGIVPQDVYPESFSSEASAGLNRLVTAKLREFGLELREIVGVLRGGAGAGARGGDADQDERMTKAQAIDRARTRKDEMIQLIFNILSCTLGTPLKPDVEFTWETYDREGKVLKIVDTPKRFYEVYSGPYRPNECFSLINDPRNEFDRLYTVERLGNVKGGLSIRYVNAPAQALENAVIACIKADQPVFFGSDCTAHGVRQGGIWDTVVYDYEKAYGFKLGMTKAQRLQTGDSLANHAMVITAVHLDDAGRPVRYKIENSWSEEAGNKGFFMCTAEWFREYVYQVVIPQKLAESKYVEILKSEKYVTLPAWDPMGALA